MKKIMFKDQFGLTQAVLEGRKTMTRRVIKDEVSLAHCKAGYTNLAIYHAAYKIGEVVAVAQSYNDIIQEAFDKGHKSLSFNAKDIMGAGCNNKMYVKAELMQHHIRITNIRVEQICNVTDEDAIKEGAKICGDKYYGKDSYGFDGFHDRFYPHPQYAYIGLIEKMGMRPSDWVFVYEFELVD